jgi:hypothetical protein
VRSGNRRIKPAPWGLALALCAAASACEDKSAIVPPQIDGSGVGDTDGGPADAGASPDAGVPLEGCDTSIPGLVCAGAARRVLTPASFETVKPEYLSDHDDCVGGGATCGDLSRDKLVTLDKACRAGNCACANGAPKCKWTEAFFDDANGNGVFDGYWIAGFGYGRPMQGVHDDMELQAIAFRREGATVAIVAADLIGFMEGDIDKIRRMVQIRNPEIGLQLLVFQSTHDHAAIDTMGLWGPEDPYSGIWVIPEEGGGGARPEYVEFVQEMAYEAVVEAVKGMKEASVFAAAVRTGDEGLVNDLRDPYVLDDNLTVLNVVATDGARIATVVNWANHPEATGADHNFVSAEYPGVLRRSLEAGLPAGGGAPAREGLGGTAIFLQGALGGMASPIGAEVRNRDGVPTPEDSFERMQALGEALADRVFEALAGAARLDDLTIRHSTREFRLLIENNDFVIGFTIGLFRDRTIHKIDTTKPSLFGNAEIDTRVVALQIGPVTFGTMPGEPFPELAVGGFDEPYPYSFGHPIVDANKENAPDLAEAPAGPFLRDMMPGEYKIVMGLAMDQLGYIIPSYDFEPGGKGDHYEEDVSLGDIQPKLFDEFKAAMNAVR